MNNKDKKIDKKELEKVIKDNKKTMDKAVEAAIDKSFAKHGKIFKKVK